MDQIAELKQKLCEVGVNVLAPDTNIREYKNGFAILEKDPHENPGELEAAFMIKITEADFHYVFLPDHRCGRSVAVEAAWAWHHFVPTIWSCLPRNATYSPEVDKELVKAFTDPRWLPDGVLSPSELLKRIGNGMVNQKRFRRARRKKLTYFQHFGFGWKPLEIVSGEGKNEKVFRPKNLER